MQIERRIFKQRKGGESLYGTYEEEVQVPRGERRSVNPYKNLDNEPLYTPTPMGGNVTIERLDTGEVTFFHDNKTLTPGFLWKQGVSETVYTAGYSQLGNRGLQHDIPLKYRVRRESFARALVHTVTKGLLG